MNSLYKTYREIWEDKIAVLLKNENLLSEESYKHWRERLTQTKEVIKNLGNDQSTEIQEQRKVLQNTVKLLKSKLEANDVIFREITQWRTRLESPMADEYHILTQIHAPSLSKKETRSIKREYEYNPNISIVKNAELSEAAWIKLKKYCQQNFLPGTWSLAACSDYAYIYSQEFNVEI